MRPELVAVQVADAPERWAELGFSVSDSAVELGGVQLRLGAPGRGIVGWTLTGIGPTEDIDGLPTEVTAPGRLAAIAHQNGAVAIDHIVVTTTDFERTAAALELAGIPLRRVVGAPQKRMGFRRLGPAILELVGTEQNGEHGPAQFWGLVVVVEDLDALAERLGDRLGSIRDAVQPGRRIATLRESGGLGQAVAFMSPEPG